MSLPIRDSFAYCLQSDSKGTHVYFFTFPPRNLDLDLIKSIFHIQKWTVQQDAIEKSINFKTYQQFSACIMTRLKKPTPKFHWQYRLTNEQQNWHNNPEKRWAYKTPIKLFFLETEQNLDIYIKCLTPLLILLQVFMTSKQHNLI